MPLLQEGYRHSNDGARHHRALFLFSVGLDCTVMRHRSLIATALCGLLLLSACGGSDIGPLQSVVNTPVGTLTPVPSPALIATATLGPTAPPSNPQQPAPTSATVIVVPRRSTSSAQSAPAAPTDTPQPTPTIDQTAVFAPPGTPNTKATSFAVILTITALAAPPTYPPTSTSRPRVRREPIIIGAGPSDRAPATTAPDATGITVQTVSPQVIAGGPAALSIKTAPGALCALQIARDGGANAEPIEGSARQSANRDGGVAWIWTVDFDEPAGSMTLIIDCGTAGVKQVQVPVVK
jgi:hypothetical protein